MTDSMDGSTQSAADQDMVRAGFKGIQAKVTIALVVVTAIVFSGSGVWDVVRMKQRKMNELTTASEMIAQRVSASMGNPFWNLDEKAIGEIVDSEMAGDLVTGVLVMERDNRTRFLGKAKTKDREVVEAPETVPGEYVRGQAPILKPGAFDMVIGHVHVLLSTANLDSELKSMIIEALLKAVCSLILTVAVLFVLINRLIIKPILLIINCINGLRNGDLDQRAEVASQDEIGLLATSFNQMLETLTAYTDSLEEGSNRIVSSSNEIAAAASQMNQGAEDQLEQVLKTSSSMEEMSTSIKEVSDNARKTSESASAVSRLAEQGAVKVKTTVEGIFEANEMIKSLKQQAQQVETVVQLIGEIAAQTNILALNAAIEAARAGEYGRGFDVVAEEIRKLAQSTTESTDEISAMIEQIQIRTEQAAEVMQSGTAMATEAGQALERIVDGVVSTTGMVRNISTAASQQARTSGGIATALQNISGISQKSAQSTKEVARAVSDLTRLADTLRQDTGKLAIRV